MAARTDAVPKGAGGILWHTQYKASDYDASYEIYTPGKDSLRFFQEEVRWYPYTRLLTWPEKLAAIANDALNNHSLDLGVDGRFFVSLEATQTLDYGERQSGPDYVSEAYRFLMGPSLFFASYRRTEEEREQWRTSTLAEKIAQSVMAQKSEAICDSWPVLPIWTVCRRYPRQNALPIQRKSTFPTDSVRARILKELNMADSSINPETGKVPGAIVDCLSGRLLFANASTFLWLCGENEYMGMKNMTFTVAGEEQRSGKWARNQLLEGEDQIAAFLKALNKMWKTARDDWVSYDYARQWTPMNWHRITADPATSRIPPAPPPPVDPLAQKTTTLTQDYASGKPFFTNNSERVRQAPKPHKVRAVTTEEDALLQRWSSLFHPHMPKSQSLTRMSPVLLTYLPYDRTIVFIAKQIQKIRQRQNKQAGIEPRRKRKKQGLDGTFDLELGSDGESLVASDESDEDDELFDTVNMMEASQVTQYF